MLRKQYGIIEQFLVCIAGATTAIIGIADRARHRPRVKCHLSARAQGGGCSLCDPHATGIKRRTPRATAPAEGEPSIRSAFSVETALQPSRVLRHGRARPPAEATLPAARQSMRETVQRRCPRATVAGRSSFVPCAVASRCVQCRRKTGHTIQVMTFAAAQAPKPMWMTPR